MPVYRPHAEFLRQAIDSVLAQTLTDLELVIVEDPSDRSGREVVESYRDPRIRYLQNDCRTGLARQHNRAVAESLAPLVARFDADDVCEPTRLEQQVAFFDANPDVDVVASQLTIIDEVGDVTGRRQYPLDHDGIVSAMRRYNPISGSNAMFRRRVVQAVGGWREDVDLPAQDYDWYSRVAISGFQFAILPAALVRYRRHGGQIKSTKLRGTIRTTLAVKRKYWLQSMRTGERCVYWAEHVLLLMPGSLVLWLLERLRYRRID